MADKVWSGNVGEWGEIYAACRLLGAGRLRVSDQVAPYQLMELQRPEHGGHVRYIIDGTKVRNLATGFEALQIDFASAADRIGSAIQNRSAGPRAFSVPDDLQHQLESLGFTRLSAGSAEHSDIALEVVRPNEIDRIQLKGFSIKTEAGASPTLYNMSTGRHIHYSITAEPSALEELSLALEAGGKGRRQAMIAFSRTHPVIVPGTAEYPQCFSSERLVSDLRSLDGDAPLLVAYAVLESYFYKSQNCSDVVKSVAAKDPLKGLSFGAYQRKYEQLWREFSRGIGGKKYSGSAKNFGGILRVKANLTIEAVPATNGVDSALLANTAFDVPDFGRWIRNIGLRALTIHEDTKATLILPWQVRWIRGKKRSG